jgi:hypothetical protein
MIKLYYISDIHTETTGEFKFNRHKNDYIVLIGDLGRPFQKEFYNTIANASKNYKIVLYICGNNECYSSNNETISDINIQIQEICDSFSNVYFLNNSGYYITPKIKIIGSILWSKISKNKYAETIANNENCSTSKFTKVRCRDIFIEKDIKATPADINKMFNENVKYIQNEIKEAKENNIELIVCTHYLPSYELCKDKNSPINYLFASNLDYLIKYPVLAYLCGHSHYNKDLFIDDIFCSMNCKGYDDEKSLYIEDKCLIIQNEED